MGLVTPSLPGKGMITHVNVVTGVGGGGVRDSAAPGREALWAGRVVRVCGPGHLCVGMNPLETCMR